MSITDPLTGLHNRRYLEARLAEELSDQSVTIIPLSFMMIDIDDFKLYNDQNGHQAGDRRTRDHRAVPAGRRCESGRCFALWR